MIAKNLLALCSGAALAAAHGGHDKQQSMAGPHKSLWYNTLPGDGGTQVCVFHVPLRSFHEAIGPPRRARAHC